jgi:energy-converting hydrogenase Eha subunit B
MNVGTVVAVAMVVAILIVMGVLHRRAERKQAELRKGRPKHDYDPPWRYP